MTVMANKKVDMFKADKTFAARVCEYMHARVWGIVYKKRLQVELEELDRKIAILDEMSKDGTEIMTADELKEAQERYASLKEEATKKYQKKVEEDATFAYSEHDNAFFKTYSKDGDHREEAVIDFCEAYGLQVQDTTMLDDIVSALGGARKASATTIIRSKAKTFTLDKRSKGDILNILYGRIAEYMIKAGTIKPQSIPDDIRQAYAKK